MRAMAFASSELAALARTTVSSPRFFQITPTCPPAAVLALWRHPRVAPTAREVHHHGQRSAAPALQATRTALVLLDQQPPCQLVLFCVFRTGCSGPHDPILTSILPDSLNMPSCSSPRSLAPPPRSPYFARSTTTGSALRRQLSRRPGLLSYFSTSNLRASSSSSASLASRARPPRRSPAMRTSTSG